MPKEVCRLLDEAIKDESEAQKFYRNLKREISREYSGELRYILSAVVEEVANAESGHGRLFRDLKNILCERR